MSSFTAKTIQQELVTFESRFSAAVRTQTPLLDRIMRYIIRRKGKQIRPMFVFLCAKLHGEVKESTYRAASLVELLHTATLVHDDVVDESMERRGFFSINAIWKNKIAVLVGDYLLSRGLLLSTEHEEFQHLHILADAVQKMSEGELLQLEKSRNLNLSESVYFDIIRQKTASLLASACGVGAYSTSKNKDITERMMTFGEKVGMAFQIKDDLFDYGSAKIGKPTGNDIREKKLTLPLIYTINRADKTLRKTLIYILKNKHKEAEQVNFVLNAVSASGGLEYAAAKMHEYKQEALSLLHSFPESPVRAELEALVQFTIDRNH
jgi:octaprenyl-diphosphate synthase